MRKVWRTRKKLFLPPNFSWKNSGEDGSEYVKNFEIVFFF
jgi:hypothetical protein